MLDKSKLLVHTYFGVQVSTLHTAATNSQAVLLRLVKFVKPIVDVNGCH